MEGTSEAVPHVIFGLDPLWVATILLVITYAAIITEKVNRAIVSLLGAGLMIMVGVLNQEAAVRGVGPCAHGAPDALLPSAD